MVLWRTRFHRRSRSTRSQTDTPASAISLRLASARKALPPVDRMQACRAEAGRAPPSPARGRTARRHARKSRRWRHWRRGRSLRPNQGKDPKVPGHRRSRGSLACPHHADHRHGFLQSQLFPRKHFVAAPRALTLCCDRRSPAQAGTFFLEWRELRAKAIYIRRKSGGRPAGSRTEGAAEPGRDEGRR